MNLISVILAVALLFIIVLLGGGLIVYIYWWLVQRPAPQLEGELDLPELEASVEVLRDRHGIPHIYAQNEADLWRAQGFTHAQDRLWQMELNRRVANGRLSEFFGAAALDVDRFSRIVGFYRAAHAELDALDQATISTMHHYCQGVNAYIRNRKGRLAAEFNLLRRQPEDWSPVDIIAFGKMMTWSLSVNWESELVRLQLAAKLDPTLAADLEPDYPNANPAISEGAGSQDSMRLLHTAGLILNEYEQLKGWLGVAAPEFGQGSNAWAVSAEKSFTGRPILCNDPHLVMSMPGTWYEMHLHCPPPPDSSNSGIHVSGASFAGAPGIIIGHNEHIAWGLTNAFPDVQDLYIERPHPDNGNGRAPRFEFRGEWEEAEVHCEEIYVRNRARPHVEEVIVTRHGPLLTGILKSDGPDASFPDEPVLTAAPLALRWIGHDPGTVLRSVLRLNRARNWQEFDAALADWSAPSQNFVYADCEDNIAYRLTGAVPIRRNGNGLVPVPGWSGDYEWEGLIPDEELPRLLNPSSGLVVTANNKITGDDYPYLLTFETMPGWRARRIEEMLTERERLTSRDMEQIQIDEVSLYARELTPLLTGHLSEDPYVRVAVNMLQDWGYRMDQESPAALVFHYTLLHLLDLTFGQKLGATAPGFFGKGSSPVFLINGFLLRAQTRLLELLKNEENSPWYADAASGRRRTREELIETALQLSVHRLRREVNPTPRKWAWGRMHQIRYSHTLGSAPILGWLFNRGPYPIGGDGTTLNQTGFFSELPPGLVQVQAAYRQIFDMGNWDAAQSVTASGQSGHPVSRNYADQIPMWLEGAYHKMPWSRAAVEKTANRRLILKGGGR
ncbi:MAG: penicillin acylase family protein [Caldilineaceae bacterium]|nr:penicillin acylase family protein [Caldilineaceae bacterium]MDE0337218.1 penicillin acylase family protein [Caldilineaceae bacterium]